MFQIVKKKVYNGSVKMIILRDFKCIMLETGAFDDNYGNDHDIDPESDAEGNSESDLESNTESDISTELPTHQNGAIVSFWIGMDLLICLGAFLKLKFIMTNEYCADKLIPPLNQYKILLACERNRINPWNAVQAKYKIPGDSLHWIIELEQCVNIGKHQQVEAYKNLNHRAQPNGTLPNMQVIGWDKDEGPCILLEYPFVEYENSSFFVHTGPGVIILQHHPVGSLLLVENTIVGFSREDVANPPLCYVDVYLITFTEVTQNDMMQIQNLSGTSSRS